MTNKRQCPLLRAAVTGASADETLPKDVFPTYCACIEHRCMFWTQTYTIEGLPIQDCAIPIIAMRNQDGKYNV